jgi:branched-chain amino acid transport system ATP-binding protein
MDILRTANLSKKFGELVAADGITLGFERGTISSIIGPNGAGKSTFFNLLSGRLAPTSGAIFYKEQEITGLQPHRIIALGIGRSFQITNIFPGLTAYENVRIGVMAHLGSSFNMFSNVAGLGRVSSETMDNLALVGLKEEKDRQAGTLAHGDQKRLEIALALTNRPELLLLDEPTAGMNPDETRRLVELIRKISRQNGLSVIFTEHDMEIVFDISDRVVVMQQGKIIADGKPDEIRKNQVVIDAYLGTEN